MSEIVFLNIDLDIESHKDISKIVSEWGNRISVNRNEKKDGVYYGSFETCCSGAENIIEEYVCLINSLSPAAREIWDKAIKRAFDFGFESGKEPNNFHFKISSEHLKKLAEVGGSIVITIYPLQNT